MKNSPGELLITVVIADLSLSHTGRSFVVTCTFGPHSPNQTKPLHRRFSEIATPTPFTQTIPYHHRHRIALHCRRQQLEKRNQRFVHQFFILPNPSVNTVLQTSSSRRRARVQQRWDGRLAWQPASSSTSPGRTQLRRVQSSPNPISSTTIHAPVRLFASLPTHSAPPV
jgi:hypothetical protein